MKEYKVLKQKETGKWSEIQDQRIVVASDQFPELWCKDIDIKWVEADYPCVDFSNYELKPVVLLSKEEYEELRNSDKIECDNCGEIVRMISTGSMCPSCLCD